MEEGWESIEKTVRDWFGVISTEGEGNPHAIFQSEEDAEEWLKTQQARTDDDRLDDYHVVVPIRNLTGWWWNLPREDLRDSALTDTERNPEINDHGR